MLNSTIETYKNFEGSANFRYRLACSVLSGQPVRFDKIRSLDEEPGLKDHEAGLLRLLELVCTGTKVKINETGTSLKFKPGLLWGGGDEGVQLVHECGTGRGIGYYLEFLLLLGPFMKNPLVITLKGVTNHTGQLDPSADLVRTVTMPLLKHFGVEGEFLIKVKRRGASPLGGGEVVFKCPVARQLKPINLVDEGKIKRVRGLSFTAKCSPQLGQRLVDSARGLLNSFLPDVYIYTDHSNGREAGLSPGFGMSLVTESTTGVVLSAELAGAKGVDCDDLGCQIAHLLLEEVSNGGVVDSCHQSMMLLLMCLGPEDVSKIRLGKLNQHTVDNLRLFKNFFGVTFTIKPDPRNQTVILSCLGTGFKNISKKVI